MKVVIFSPKALEDFDDIWLYIAQDNIEEADFFVDGIEILCTQKLALFPKMGKPRDYLIEAVLAFPHRDYVIYYRVGKKALEIVRIMHSSVDVSGGI